MTPQELAKIILNTDGEPFYCTFIKRGNGETRHMHGQLGVKKDLKGVGLAYVPKEHKLISAFDLNADGYRMIPVEGLIAVTYGGRTYEYSEATEEKEETEAIGEEKDKEETKVERKELRVQEEIKRGYVSPIIAKHKQFQIDGLCISCRKIRGKEETKRCDKCDDEVNKILRYLINGKKQV